MSTIQDRIAHRTLLLSGAKAAPPPRRIRVGGYANNDKWDIPDPTQAQKQTALYANLAWIQIAVATVAKFVATTPFQVSELVGEDTRAIKNHPFELRLRNPNPLQSRYEFIEATAGWKKNTGNCYWWLNCPGGENTPPEELWIIPSTHMQPVPDGRMGLTGYLYDDGAGTKLALETWEVVHHKTWNPLNKYVGLSAVQALFMDSVGDLGAQEYNARFYDRGRVKGQGILAFKDFIEDGAWKRLAADWEEQHGGKQNKGVIRLRGVGQGVSWIPTALSQAETKYLEIRQFTKEEIFALLAPGLSSLLAVNATEANSTAGKDTFLEQAIYPEHVAIAEKISQNPLPSYGDNLVGAFDDVRRVDTQIELQEQAEYSKSHTVDEVRAKYYNDGPLGDDRGRLLPAEIGKGLTDGRKPEDKPPPVPFGQQPDALEQAQKRLDKERWQKKALKAIVAGRSADVPFDPDYLSDDDAMPIRAALQRAYSAEDVKKAFGE